MINNKNLIYIGGPTGVGKTAIAIHIAKNLSAEIVSCDSRQFYKEMSIGTAVPSNEEINLVKHHFIQDRSIKNPLNVGTYQKESISKINKILENNKYVILVGGSGLYANSVLFGIDKFPKVNNSTIRKLNNIYINGGIKILQKELKIRDYESYKSIDINNHRRLIRVLSVCVETNLKYSSFLGKTKEVRKFNHQIYIISDDRNIIYNKINKRVDRMIKNGLENEAESLYKDNNSIVFETVGYKEWVSYWNGLKSKTKTIDEIKKNTRRYAKRQLTWFKKYDEALWLKPNGAANKILNNYK